MSSGSYNPTTTVEGDYGLLINQAEVMDKFVDNATKYWFKDHLCYSGQKARLESIRGQALSFTLAMATKTHIPQQLHAPATDPVLPTKEEITRMIEEVESFHDTWTVRQLADFIKDMFELYRFRRYAKTQLRKVSEAILERVEAIMRRTNPAYFYNIVKVAAPSGNVMDTTDAIHFLRCNYPPFEKCVTHEQVGNLFSSLAEVFYSTSREGFASFSEDAEMTFIVGYLRRCVEIHTDNVSDPAKVQVLPSAVVKDIAEGIQSELYQMGLHQAHTLVLSTICPEDVVYKFSDAGFLTLAVPVSALMKWNVTGTWSRGRPYHIDARHALNQTEGSEPLVRLTGEEVVAIRMEARRVFSRTPMPGPAVPSKDKVAPAPSVVSGKDKAKPSKPIGVSVDRTGRNAPQEVVDVPLSFDRSRFPDPPASKGKGKGRAGGGDSKKAVPVVAAPVVEKSAKKIPKAPEHAKPLPGSSKKKARTPSPEPAPSRPSKKARKVRTPSPEPAPSASPSPVKKSKKDRAPTPATPPPPPFVDLIATGDHATLLLEFQNDLDT